MDNQEEVKITQIPIGHRGYSSQSLLSVSTLIEHKDFVQDVVFVETRKGVQTSQGFRYDKNTAKKMKINAIELRSLAYAMKHLFKSKNPDVTNYKKQTKSSILRLNYSPAYEDKGEVFYVNIHNSNASKDFIGVPFEGYDFLSFAESLLIMAKELEELFFKYQRKAKKDSTPKD